MGFGNAIISKMKNIVMGFRNAISECDVFLKSEKKNIKTFSH